MQSFTGLHRTFADKRAALLLLYGSLLQILHTLPDLCVHLLHLLLHHVMLSWHHQPAETITRQPQSVETNATASSDLTEHSVFTT